MVLLRRVIGDALRARRQAQHRTLREVSTAANVSLGYLSEIERGQKEASSELLAAICGALGARLSELLREVSHTVANAERVAGGPSAGESARADRAAAERAVLGGRGLAGTALDGAALDGAAFDGAEFDEVSLGGLSLDGLVAEDGDRSGDEADQEVGVHARAAQGPPEDGAASSRGRAPVGGRTPPNRAPSGRGPSDRASSDRASSDRAPSDRASSGRASSDRASSGRAAPGRAAPDRAATEREAARPTGSGARAGAVKASAARARLSTLADREVSVTVRQDGPLKATLQARRTLTGDQPRDMLVTV